MGWSTLEEAAEWRGLVQGHGVAIQHAAQPAVLLDKHVRGSRAFQQTTDCGLTAPRCLWLGSSRQATSHHWTPVASGGLLRAPKWLTPSSRPDRRLSKCVSRCVRQDTDAAVCVQETWPELARFGWQTYACATLLRHGP